MKKQNGFMLAELIISSTIVMGTMVTLYATFTRLYSLYQQKITYYNIDGIYATKKMIDVLMDNDFNKFITEELKVNENNQKYIIKDNVCQITSESDEDNAWKSACKSIQEFYHIKNMIISEYDKCILGSKKCDDENNEEENSSNVENNTEIEDYIEYVVEYYDMQEKNEYEYIAITELEENDKTYYSNLRIR